MNASLKRWFHGAGRPLKKAHSSEIKVVQSPVPLTKACMGTSTKDQHWIQENQTNLGTHTQKRGFLGAEWANPVTYSTHWGRETASLHVVLN